MHTSFGAGACRLSLPAKPVRWAAGSAPGCTALLRSSQGSVSVALCDLGQTLNLVELLCFLSDSESRRAGGTGRARSRERLHVKPPGPGQAELAAFPFKMMQSHPAILNTSTKGTPPNQTVTSFLRQPSLPQRRFPFQGKIKSQGFSVQTGTGETVASPSSLRRLRAPCSHLKSFPLGTGSFGPSNPR